MSRERNDDNLFAQILWIFSGSELVISLYGDVGSDLVESNEGDYFVKFVAQEDLYLMAHLYPLPLFIESYIVIV